ncbi:neoverrucotoxin subunit beta-like [Spinachia spinachia]
MRAHTTYHVSLADYKGVATLNVLPVTGGAVCVDVIAMTWRSFPETGSLIRSVCVCVRVRVRVRARIRAAADLFCLADSLRGWTMDSEPSCTMEVAALGRPFSLGMLYDCRNDLLVPGMTLWDLEDLKTHIGERPKNYNGFEIVASESIADKSAALKVEASLKASFLCGLVKVEGSAKYLDNSKTSRNQARVTLNYKTTTKFQELSMNHLGRGNVKHPYVFDQGLATHVVTGILYGAQAFFVFDREVSEDENHQDIQGDLKVVINKFPTINIEGDGSLKMEEKDKKKVDKFSCKFHGDFSLEKNPVSFREAVEVYQSLPRLLGANKENVVPMTVWLLPLSGLDSSAAKVVRQISIRLVQESQSVLEHFSELEMRCNDALNNTTAQKFPQIGKKIKTFKEMCSESRLELQQTLARKLPSIRGGGEEEAVLADILKKRHSSPFNSENLNKWIESKEREIHTLKSFTNMMKNTKIAPSRNDLNREILCSEHVMCFVFTSLGHPESYLSTMSSYLSQREEPTQDAHTQDIEKEQWFLSNKVADTVRLKAKLFSDFAEDNKENENIRFLTLGLANEAQKGSSIYLYTDGFSVSENFEPPSRPETLTVSDINHNSVTLKVSPPRSGAENITSYSVEYCVSGEDGWKQKAASRDDEVPVSGLGPNTKYMFRCRAVTSAGVGPAEQVSGPIRTLPCSPPGKPQVEPNSTEVFVSWEKPAELGQDVPLLSYMVEYAETKDGVKEDSLRWKRIMSTAEKAVVSGLQADTEYVVRVRCDCDAAGRSKESATVQVCTTKFRPLPEYLKRTSVKMNSGSPSVYQLTLKKEDVKIDGCTKITFGQESMRKNRTIILFGATGSRKSTLINGMINYLVGVEWKDAFRFQMVEEDQSRCQAESQTSEVTVYKIHHQEGFQIPFSLTIIDTPSLGGTEDTERGWEVIQHLCELFAAEDGVTDIDALCFIVPVAAERLSKSQQDVLDSLLSIFGEDKADSICYLGTSTDVPCPKTRRALPIHFKFNNSALFAGNKSPAADGDDEDEEGEFYQMCWNMGAKCMKKFFVALNTLQARNLSWP